MKGRRIATSLLIAVCGLRFLVGCGGNGGGGTPSGPAGSVEGWVFVQGGTVKLGNTATPPAGFAAASGASVTIDGRSGAVTSDASGHFLVTGVPIGQRVMHLAVPVGNPALARDVPLTVVASATIQTGEFPFSRQQAIDTAKTALAGLGTVTDFRILAPQQPLPVGVTLEPALGDDRGQADAALVYHVAAPQWLVYADQLPTQRFQHPVSYVLVDAQSGAVTLRDATSWPRINQVSEYADDDKNATAPDLVQVGTRAAKSRLSEEVVQILRSSRASRDHVPGATDPKTYALIVEGNSRSDMDTDFENVKAGLFGANGLSGPVDVRTWAPPLSGTVDAANDVKTMFNQICFQARAQDTILVYLTSHGSKLGGVYLQRGVEADESTTMDAVIYPFLDLDTSRCKACHIVFIIDACYSGAAMVDMDVRTPPHAGQKRWILVSSTSAETSGGITNRITAETGKTKGGLFTNAFLASLKDYSQTHSGANPSNLTDIFNGAVQKLNSTRQHPQTVFRWDGQVCGAQPALVEVTPQSVTEKHTVGVTPCPQGLGNLTIKNVSSLSVSYSLSSTSSYFNLSGSGGSLTPGQSKSVGLSFNCGSQPPLSGSIHVMASAGTASQEVTVPLTLNRGP